MSLPFPKRYDWRKRWLATPRGRVLHRIAEPERDVWGRYEGPDWGQLEGKAVCGTRGTFSMPGILGRMGGQRCARCCAKLGLPEGYGSPFNSDILEPGCEGPEDPKPSLRSYATWT